MGFLHLGPSAGDFLGSVQSGALVEVLPRYRAIELGVHAVYPSRKHLKPKMRVLIDFLVRAFRVPPWPA